MLSPHLDPNAAIRRHAADITQSNIVRDGKPIGLADNEFQVRVDAIDETRLMEGLQKVANRIALGLVLAALIVGAALLMDVPTSFQIFGYPGLAMMLFLAAAAGGGALAVSILANDIKAKRKAKT